MNLSLEFLFATGIGWTTGCAVFLMLRGRSLPVVLGLTVLNYAVNGFIFATGRLWLGKPPIVGADGSAMADPLPQALVLTAIVIGFATTALAIALAVRARHEAGTDRVDGGHAPEDRVR